MLNLRTTVPILLSTDTLRFSTSISLLFTRYSVGLSAVQPLSINVAACKLTCWITFTLITLSASTLAFSSVFNVTVVSLTLVTSYSSSWLANLTTSPSFSSAVFSFSWITFVPACASLSTSVTLLPLSKNSILYALTSLLINAVPS